MRMCPVQNMADYWRRLAIAGLAALALVLIPFHPVLAMGPALPDGVHEVAAMSDTHHQGSKSAEHAWPAAMAGAHIPCGMSACGVATLPSLVSLAVRAAFHLGPRFPTESGQAQFAAAPEQPPPRA